MGNPHLKHTQCEISDVERDCSEDQRHLHSEWNIFNVAKKKNG